MTFSGSLDKFVSGDLAVTSNLMSMILCGTHLNVNDIVRNEFKCQ